MAIVTRTVDGLTGQWDDVALKWVSPPELLVNRGKITSLKASLPITISSVYTTVLNLQGVAGKLKYIVASRGASDGAIGGLTVQVDGALSGNLLSTSISLALSTTAGQSLVILPINEEFTQELVIKAVTGSGGDPIVYAVYT